MKTMPKTFWIGVSLMAVGLVAMMALGAFAWRAHAAGHLGYAAHPMLDGREGGYDGYGPRGRYGVRTGRGVGGAIPPVEGARAVQIMTTDAGCSPDTVNVKVGETVTVRFVNAGDTERALIIPGMRILIRARAGQTVLTGLRTDRAAEYRFGCPAPGTRDSGPVGRISVAP